MHDDLRTFDDVMAALSKASTVKALEVLADAVQARFDADVQLLKIRDEEWDRYSVHFIAKFKQLQSWRDSNSGAVQRNTQPIAQHSNEDTILAAQAEAKRAYSSDVRAQNVFVYEVGKLLGLDREAVSQIINPKSVSRDAGMDR